MKHSAMLPLESKEDRRRRIWKSCSDAWFGNAELKCFWKNKAVTENRRLKAATEVVASVNSPAAAGPELAVSLLPSGHFVAIVILCV